MIIGVTGTIASGKNGVHDFLVEHGFKHISLSGIIRDIAIKNWIGIERKALQDLGNKLREQNGAECLAKEAVEIAERNGWKNFVISGIRNPAEIIELKKRPDFVLIGVDAPQESRFERILQRRKDNDPSTWEEFLKMDNRDLGIGENDLGQGVQKCLSMADFKIKNDSNFEGFENKIKEVYTEVKQVFEKTESRFNDKMKSDSRPSWEEYFIGIVEAVSKRGTCNRGYSGAVIVKDKGIISTGYASSPKGIEHCDEVGHDIQTRIHADGTKTQHCVRTAHAEMNAICQAANLGISTNGTTMYTKMTPCIVCARAIVNSGIKKVVCLKKYRGGKKSEELFKKAGVEIELLTDELENYENM